MTFLQSYVCPVMALLSVLTNTWRGCVVFRAGITTRSCAAAAAHTRMVRPARASVGFMMVPLLVPREQPHSAVKAFECQVRSAFADPSFAGSPGTVHKSGAAGLHR